MSANAVVIGLGSNLKNKVANLRLALSHIKKIPGIKVKSISAIYESSAQVPQKSLSEWNLDFLNAAVLVEVSDSVSPDQLLQNLKKIEKAMGRTTAEVWAPRIIDLDILYWEGINLNESHLKIPHVRLLDRPFALLPMLDIYPDAKIVKPSWAQGWISSKPFETCKSEKYFWPKLVGIVNVTTDSFSDGSEKLNFDKINQLMISGADIIELGAESTRPGAKPVSVETEWYNLKSALDYLSSLPKSDLKSEIEIGIDSYKPSVIAKCLEYFKVDYINDVTGFHDSEMKHLLKISGRKGIVMHSLSVPPNPNELLTDDQNPVDLLSKWWQFKKLELLAFGINENQLIFDPGIGFGKTKQQNLFLLKNLDMFHTIQDDIFIGHSRKSYQSLYSNRLAESRDLETALMTADLNLAYVQYLRLHDLETQKIGLRFK